MGTFSVGMSVANMKIPSLCGKITQLHDNGRAMIEIKDKNSNTKEMYICLEYWKIHN